MTEEEYLSHMQKEDKFLPVVTVVIYYGEKAWDGARDLHGVCKSSCFCNSNIASLDSLEYFIIFSIGWLSFKKVVEYEDSHIIDEDVVCALAATNNINIEKTKRKEQLKVCTLFEEIAKVLDFSTAYRKHMRQGSLLALAFHSELYPDFQSLQVQTLPPLPS